MKDDVSIVNLALARISVTMQIQSLTERSKEAVQANLVYDLTRDKVLSDAPWPFARKLASLQLTGTAPERWKYRYEYPNNCLKVRRILPPIDGYPTDTFRRGMNQGHIPYELEAGDSDNLTLCTDQEAAAAEYTVRITNPVRFDAKFKSTFAWALAAELALPLAKGIDYAKNAAAAYEKEIGEAIARALNEEKRDAPPESEFVLARL